MSSQYSISDVQSQINNISCTIISSLSLKTLLERISRKRFNILTYGAELLIFIYQIFDLGATIRLIS